MDWGSAVEWEDLNTWLFLFHYFLLRILFFLLLFEMLHVMLWKWLPYLSRTKVRNLYSNASLHLTARQIEYKRKGLWTSSLHICFSSLATYNFNFAGVFSSLCFSLNIFYAYALMLHCIWRILSWDETPQR